MATVPGGVAEGLGVAAGGGVGVASRPPAGGVAGCPPGPTVGVRDEPPPPCGVAALPGIRVDTRVGDGTRGTVGVAPATAGGGVPTPDVAGASFPRPAMKIGTNARLEFAADGLRSRFTAS
ncbi:MAG: hypothetical protein ACYC9X_02920, partial [Dehalococcoidia bacterium]